jgi:hypothetical protein
MLSRSVGNYQSRRRNIPEQRGLQIKTYVITTVQNLEVLVWERALKETVVYPQFKIMFVLAETFD